jgi:hypothetical protein
MTISDHRTKILQQKDEEKANVKAELSDEGETNE